MLLLTSTRWFRSPANAGDAFASMRCHADQVAVTFLRFLNDGLVNGDIGDSCGSASDTLGCAISKAACKTLSASL